jgi:hypothetical protein
MFVRVKSGGSALFGQAVLEGGYMYIRRFMPPFQRYSNPDVLKIALV